MNHEDTGRGLAVESRFTRQAKIDLLAILAVILAAVALTALVELSDWLNNRKPVGSEAEEVLLFGLLLTVSTSFYTYRRLVETRGLNLALRNDLEDLKSTNGYLSARLSELELHNERNRALLDLESQLRASRTITEAATIISTFARRLLPERSGALFLENPERNYVEQVAAWGESTPGDQPFLPQDCWAIRRGAVNVERSGNGGLTCPHLGATPPDYTACVPIRAHGETFGVILLHANDGAGPHVSEAAEFWGEDLETAQVLSERAATALANLRLRKAIRSQSIRDPLTGLFNRRYLEETLQREVSRAIRHQTSFGLILLDIDHFRTFNDKHGQSAGDVLLQKLGSFFNQYTREEDIACRYGGEEFAIVLLDAGLDSTKRCAQHIQQAVRNIRASYPGKELPTVNVSIGVAAYPEHGNSGYLLIRAASEALSRAKENGRGRVEVSTLKPVSASDDL